LEQRNLTSFSWMPWVVLILIGLPTFAAGAYMVASQEQPSFEVLAAGLVIIAASLIGWPITRSLDAARSEADAAAQLRAKAFTDKMQEMSILLNMISEQQLVSDRAKSVAFREKDHEVLRRAIYDDMQKQDWEAAMALANAIETHFGYKQEADQFRAEINRRWQETARKVITDAVANLERLVRGEQWKEAQQEAQRLLEQYPNDQQVRGLPQEIENRRQGVKNELLKRFEELTARNDTDAAMDVLRQLDMYLSPQEAERLHGPAKQLFRDRLNHLRTKLSLAVQDHKWTEAKELAETIAGEYPNTRVAQEATEMLPRLRDRASRETHKAEDKQETVEN
jgi:hypothetical protein